jgi:hypothetical protein
MVTVVAKTQRRGLNKDGGGSTTMAAAQLQWRRLHDNGGGSVQANIEYLYIRSYGQTASVTSNLRVYSRT